MPQLLLTLVGEGPTDNALLPIIEWTLNSLELGLLPDVEFVSRFVGPKETPGVFDVVERAVVSMVDFPCDLLFLHHDADGPTASPWADQIRAAVVDSRQQGQVVPPAVPVVPVREMEAWLLIDEQAIRLAAGAARGTTPLDLPRGRAIERCPDPKLILRQALQKASGLPGRRLRDLDDVRPLDVAAVIRSFAALRRLPAFRAFEADVRRVIGEQGWPERLG